MAWPAALRTNIIRGHRTSDIGLRTTDYGLRSSRELLRGRFGVEGRTDRLAGAASFAATAPGIYGLLADTADERRALRSKVYTRWHELEAGGFRERLRALAHGLSEA